MELSFNVNTPDTPVNTKVCGYGGETAIFLDNVSQAKTGTRINVEGKRSAIVEVTGTFEAEMLVLGYFNDDDYKMVKLLVKDAISGERINTITKAGLYLVDVSNLTRMTVRCDKYTSGTISATGKIYANPLQEGAFPSDVNVLSNPSRNTMIAHSFNVSVDAGQTKDVLVNIPVNEFPFNYLVFRANAKHSMVASLWYRHTPAGGLGAPQGTIDVFSGNLERGASDWIEVKGDMVSVKITNNSTETRAYDVYLYGVR